MSNQINNFIFNFIFYFNSSFIEIKYSFIKHTPFKYTIQCSLVYSEMSNHQHYLLWNIFITPKWNPIFINRHSPFCSLPALTITNLFQSVLICPFLMLSVKSYNLQFSIFGLNSSRMFSSFHSCCSTLLVCSFCNWNDIPHCMFNLINSWEFGSFYWPL